jgi:hypothetical protein
MLSCRPASLNRLAESMHWSRFLCSLNVYKNSGSGLLRLWHWIRLSNHSARSHLYIFLEYAKHGIFLCAYRFHNFGRLLIHRTRNISRFSLVYARVADFHSFVPNWQNLVVQDIANKCTGPREITRRRGKNVDLMLQILY